MEKKSKTISMTSKTNENATEKLSYEQLEQIAGNLNMQCKQLQNNLHEAQQIISGFNTLEMLLAIIEKGEYFESSFIDKCVEKIQKGVTTMLENADKNEESEE
mgnify:CR=1 FL=1